MKNEVKESRRSFLSKTAAVAAVPSIIAIQSLAPNKVKAGSNPRRPVGGDTVITDAEQTLSNKLIPSRKNILGTDHVNIREWPLIGNNITGALNDAIASLSGPGSYGGQILIPHGIWISNGGHEIKNSISIEGTGFHIQSGYWGTEIQMAPVPATPDRCMFRISTAGGTNGLGYHASLKNLSINMQNVSDSIGLFMTDGSNPAGDIKQVSIENVGFINANYGIKVDSTNNAQFECILNRFERLAFNNCQVSFRNNTINSGFTFDNCYFYVPPHGIALECPRVGNLAVEHCLFAGTSVNPSHTSTILTTEHEFNNISFYDCQDEGVQYAHRNTGANVYEIVPLIYRNCIIQSKFIFTTGRSLILDSCRITTDSSGAIHDSLGGVTGYVNVYIKGVTNFRTVLIADNGTIGTFLNPYSRVIYESKEVGVQYVELGAAQGTYVTNTTLGIVKIPVGFNSIRVYNNLINCHSIVFAQLRKPAPDGNHVCAVACELGYFDIHLAQSLTGTPIDVGFKVHAVPTGVPCPTPTPTPTSTPTPPIKIDE